MNISFESSYYNFIKYENIKNIEIYDKFLNWIKGEFDLYQMEEMNGLIVYFQMVGSVLQFCLREN